MFYQDNYFVLIEIDGKQRRQLVKGFIHESEFFGYKINFDLQIDRDVIDIDHLPTGLKVYSYPYKIGKEKKIEDIINRLVTRIPLDFLRAKKPQEVEKLEIWLRRSFVKP